MNEKNYINDAFTKEGENTNVEVNQLKATCITSTNNKFELDSEGNLTVKSIQTENNQVPGAIDVLNSVYPVGSIYMSVNNTNPNTLFGGTWEQLKDKFLLACGDNYPNGSVGGEELHILSIEEMPGHYHEINRCYGGISLVDSSDRKSSAAPADGAWWSNGGTSIVGASQPHNNMPPYLAVYIWKRID